MCNLCRSGQATATGSSLDCVTWSHGGVKLPQLVLQPPEALPIVWLCLAVLELYKNSSFENHISGMVNNCFLNSKLIANVPKSPRLGEEEKPKESTGPSGKAREDGMELWEVPRVPVTVKDLPDGTPSKPCEGAGEEDMPRIFHLTAKRAVARGRAMSCRYLLTRRQSI